MTTDVRTLLHGAAEAPERAPDIDGAIRSARDRRRRHRGLSALAAAVVLALVGGALVFGGGGGADEAHVAIGQTSPAVPDGWKTVTGPGVSMGIPPGWDAYDFGQAGGQRAALAVGTSPLPSHGVPAACVQPGSGGADVVIPTTPGIWIAVWEAADPTSTEFALPAGDMLSVQPRPESFGRFAVTGGTCAHVGEDPGSALAGAFTEFAFVDAGRVFGVKVVAASSTDDVTIPEEGKPKLAGLERQIDALKAQLAGGAVAADPIQAQLEALQQQYDGLFQHYASLDRSASLKYAMDVMNTLRVEPAETTTSTTVPTTTSPLTNLPSITQLPVTTTPPFVATTDDEREIVAVFQAWADDQTDAELDATVENPDAVRAPSHQGWEQQSPESLAAYDGRVESIRIVDADHAQVVYTILHSGVPVYPNRQGSAVRMDGKWKVSTETVCGMLHLGGITCPV